MKIWIDEMIMNFALKKISSLLISLTVANAYHIVNYYYLTS
jgi:hypothetical protein